MKVDHITVICFFLEKNGKRRIKKLLQMEVDPLPVSQVPPFSAPPPEQKNEEEKPPPDQKNDLKTSPW